MSSHQAEAANFRSQRAAALWPKNGVTKTSASARRWCCAKQPKWVFFSGGGATWEVGRSALVGWLLRRQPLGCSGV